MSRLRKGKKFKGGSFAQTFRKGIAMKAPFAVVVAGEDNTEEPPSPEDLDEDTSNAAKTSLGPKDEVPNDVDYSREEVDDYFEMRKQAKEEAAEAKAKEEEAAAAEEEAAAAEAEREGLSQGENIAGSFENEYSDDMTGKERRQESRENKGQIRDAKKEAKAAAKDELKNKKKAIKASGLKGKDKRQAKKSARKDKKADKKSIRKNKRSAKKSNRKAKRGK